MQRPSFSYKGQGRGRSNTLTGTAWRDLSYQRTNSTFRSHGLLNEPNDLFQSLR